MRRIAILHPGQMGAEVGRALVDVGYDVGWLPKGRGSGTRRRAADACLRELDDLRDCDLVLSICPPGAAVETARSLGGFTGLFVDANAISPATAGEVANAVSDLGIEYVDGGIIGPPPKREGTTRLYLSGGRAEEVAGVFEGSRLDSIVLPGGDSAASALKMTYAAWTKISAALLVSIGATADQLGVADALALEWERSQPGLQARQAAALQSAQAKGWRWADEMREIARTFSAAGQPDGFGDAAAEQFSRWPRPADD
jgi:3-hydroxyisobutyrate dehydrogenase-like beta-hydroxyacid dehydrogenase